MASTYSSSLRLELMATGDQSGTWGDTTNTNLGTLLEQAITGYLSVAQGDVANLTLTTVNGGSDQARNAIVNVTGALTAQRNVVVQTANKLYLIKNATTGGFSIVVKTAAGTGVTVVNGASRLVYSDGTNVVDGQFGPLLPSSNDGGALGAVGTAWSDLFGATGFAFNLNNDWIATHSAAVLTVGTGDLRVTTAGTNAASVVTVGGTQTLTNKTMTSPVLNTPTVGTSLLPTTDDGAPLGSTTKEWSDLFLASGGVINWGAGDVTVTHSSGLLTTTGNFAISKASPTLVLNKAAAAQNNQITGQTASSLRWAMFLGENTAESGSNAGSLFTLAAYSDAAALIDIPIQMARAAGSALISTRPIRSTAVTGIGYNTGAGGTVTQLTNKSTGVSLNAASGQITLNNAALGSATTVSFTFTNTSIAAGDVLVLNHVSGGTAGAYTLNAQCGAGSASINVRNVTGGSLSEAIVIGFVLIKGVTA